MLTRMAEAGQASTPEHEEFCGRLHRARGAVEQEHAFFVYPADRKLINLAWDTHRPAAEFCRNCERSSSQTSEVGIVRWICRGHAGPVIVDLISDSEEESGAESEVEGNLVANAPACQIAPWPEEPAGAPARVFETTISDSSDGVSLRNWEEEVRIAGEAVAPHTPRVGQAFDVPRPGTLIPKGGCRGAPVRPPRPAQWLAISNHFPLRNACNPM
jgi:hypothetical protein